MATQLYAPPGRGRRQFTVRGPWFYHEFTMRTPWFHRANTVRAPCVHRFPRGLQYADSGHVPGSNRHECACRRVALQSRSVAPSVAAGGRSPMAINLSVPLVLEYEQTLKRVCTGGDLNSDDVDSVIDFLCANANLRPISSFGGPPTRPKG